MYSNLLRQRIRKRYFKTLGTSVINISKKQPYVPSLPVRALVHTYIHDHIKKYKNECMFLHSSKNTKQASTLDCTYILLVPKVLWALSLFRGFGYVLLNLDWVVQSISIQTFSLISLIYRRGNFVY